MLVYPRQLPFNRPPLKDVIMFSYKMRSLLGWFCIVVSFACSLPATQATAQEKLEAKSKPKVDLPPGITWDFDVPYIKDGDPAQRLDVYYPETKTQQPQPLIVHIHGGGWMGGNKFPCDVRMMTAHGYTVASIEYRFSQKAKFPRTDTGLPGCDPMASIKCFAIQHRSQKSRRYRWICGRASFCSSRRYG